MGPLADEKEPCPAAGRTLVERVQDFIRERRLLEPREGVVTGVSGGPDSICLLHVLTELNRLYDWRWGLIVAHLHHGLRGPEADADEACVHDAAQRLKAPFFSSRVDVASLAAQTRCGIEEAARRARYEFLRGVAEENGAAAVAVGHHADDAAETVLLRLGRGAGLWGMAALAPSRALAAGSAVRLVRPLLRVRRREILQYLDSRNLEYRIDRSNLDTRFRRNFIRHRLIPEMEEAAGCAVIESLIDINSRAVEILEGLDRLIEPFWHRSMKEHGRAPFVLVPWEAWNSTAGTVRKYLIRKAVGFVSEPDSPVALAEKHYEILAGLSARTDVGRSFSLPGGTTARIEHDGLLFRAASGGSDAGRKAGPAMPLQIEGEKFYEPFNVKIKAELTAAAEDPVAYARAAGGPLAAILDADRTGTRLSLRVRKEGDRFTPLGAPGSKKLKDFFIDSKIPERKRGLTPLVVTDRDEIVWVVGRRIAEPFKCTASTKRVLRLVAEASAPGVF